MHLQSTRCSQNPVSLQKIFRGKSHFKANTKSRQGRDARPNSFELLPQLHPNPTLQLGSLLTLCEARRRRDAAVRHVLTVGLRSYAGTVRECARTNLGPACQEVYGKTDGAAVTVFSVEFTKAETRRIEVCSALDSIPINF